MKKLKYLIISISFFAMFSCEDFMSPEQDQTISPEYAISSRDYFLGTLYAAYLGIPDKVPFDYDATTDDMVTNKEGTPSSRFAKGGLSTQSNPLDEIWSNCYTQINRINWFLDKMTLKQGIEKFPTPVRFDLDSAVNMQKFYFYKAEGYFLRAWYFAELLKYYGGAGNDSKIYGVPLFKKHITIEDNLDIPRDLYTSCVDQIVSDCDTAIKYLPLNYSKFTGNLTVGLQADAGHASGAAAYALKARVLLYAASPAFNVDNDQQRWIDATNAAGAAITAIGFDNLLGFTSYLSKSNLNDKNYSNKDLFFRGPIKNNDNTLETENFPPRAFGGKGYYNPTQNIVDAFPMSDGYPLGTSPSKLVDPTDVSKNRDIRLDLFIVRTGESFAQKDINTQEGGTDGLGSDINATRTGYYIQKFLDGNVSLEKGKEVKTTRAYILLAKPELYLNFAEAALMATGNPDTKIAGYTAREVLAKIRNRSLGIGKDLYINTIINSTIFLELIRNERRIELCFENHRFWDLRRWSLNATDLENINKPTFSMYDSTQPVENRSFRSVFMPLPYGELLKTKNLKNNQGW